MGNTIRDIVRDMLHERGMTYKDFAEVLGVADQTVVFSMLHSSMSLHRANRILSELGAELAVVNSESGEVISRIEAREDDTRRAIAKKRKGEKTP